MDSSIRRPQRGDNEDDLLGFQRQFLASGQQPCAKVVKCYNKSENYNASTGMQKDSNAQVTVDKQQSEDHDENMEEEMKKYDTHITTVLSEIVKERNLNVVPKFPSFKPTANPQAMPCSYKKQSHFAKSKKRSLFAQQFKNTGTTQDKSEAETSATNSNTSVLETDLHQIYPSSRLLTGDGLKSFDKNQEGIVQAIHEENIDKLSQMSADDISQEQLKLKGSLDSKILAFLKKRPKKTEPSPVEEEYEDNAPSNKVPIKVDEKWVHMNDIESEKMTWMEEVPNHKQSKEIKLPNRFDFNGRLLSLNESESLPSHMGLHHHGSEPDLGGYTLQELLSLARSQFSQQQVFAFRLFAKIILKDKLGEYYSVLSRFVAPLLLEAGFAFILRWALDQRSDNCIQAAIEALHALVHSGRLQDSVSDQCFLNFRGCEFPSFDPCFYDGKASKDESDYQLVTRDLLKGFMQMEITVRMRYVLEVCQPDQSVINNCLEVLQRCCQHSTELAVKVFECPRLVAFVVKNYLPIVWPSDVPDNQKQSSSWPCKNAVRFLRLLCQSGRHVTSRIIHDYPHIKSFLFKVFAFNEGPPIRDFHAAALEAWMLWTVCLSYGFYVDLYRELFPSLVLQVRACIEIMEKDLDYEPLEWVQYIIKAISAIFNNLSTDEKVDNSYLRWEEVKEFYSLIRTLVRKAILLYSADEVKERKVNLCGVIAMGVDVMTSCFEKVHSIADEIESEIFPFILQPLQSIAIECAAILKTVVRLPVETIIKSFPSLHLSTLTEEDGEEILINLKKVNFVTSFLRFCVAICRANRAVCVKFVQFFTDWCRMDENNSIAMNDMFGFCNRAKQHCIFWLSKLYITCVIEIPTLRKYSKPMHLLSLRCISSLGFGDEEYLRILLYDLLFCVDFFSCSDAVSGGSTNYHDIANSLPSIRSTYMFLSTCAPKLLVASKNRSFQHPRAISSFLLPPEDGPLLPTDWPFLPLVHFYDRAIHEGEPADQKSIEIVKSNVKSCLYFLLFLERFRKEFWSKLNITAKITRLMCLYLAGSDVFFDDIISSLMKLIFQLYTQDQTLPIDFGLPVPGVVSFYDFYTSLLDQYEGVSYGDPLFTAVVLLPVTASSTSNFKLALWAEHTAALRFMCLTEEQLLIPKRTYLSPPEQDVNVIRSYLRALITGHCQSQRSPFLYQLALHHVGSYASDTSRRSEILHIIHKLPDQDLRSSLLNYQQPDD